MVVTIHQPEHLPWLGFFAKVQQADVWVMLDHVQFRKHYYQNRNRIRGHRGSVWVTVPVLTAGKSSQPINEVLISNQSNPRWQENCWTSLVQYYQHAPYWSAHREALEGFYHTQWGRLVDLNEAIIRYLLSALSIEVQIVKSSQMDVRGHQGDLLLDICRQLGADVYLSGISGREYLEVERFEKASIEVRFQEFHHPIYQQRYEPFIPCLSACDLLLNYGPNSPDVLKGVGVETMEQVVE